LQLDAHDLSVLHASIVAGVPYAAVNTENISLIPSDVAALVAAGV